MPFQLQSDQVNSQLRIKQRQYDVFYIKLMRMLEENATFSSLFALFLSLSLRLLPSIPSSALMPPSVAQ